MDDLMKLVVGCSIIQPTTYYIPPTSWRLPKTKIGHSVAIDERISQMQCHNHHHLRLLGDIPGGRRLEKEWHKKFSHLRVSGEWFSYTEELKSEIEKALSS